MNFPMNKRMYLNFCFYIAGSILIAILYAIVLANFFKDAKLFEKPAMVVVDDSTKDQAGNAGNSPQSDGISGTIKFTRPGSDAAKKTETPKDDNKTVPAETPKPSAETAKPGASTTVPTKTVTGTIAPSANPTTKDTPADEGTNDPNVVDVEIVNYSIDEQAAKNVKAALETAGYKVTIRNEHNTGAVDTVILQRTEDGDAGKVFGVLGIGRIQKDLMEQSRYDIVMILGNDIAP